MRSLATWALVAGLALIALAAAVDALRAGGAASQAAPARVEAPAVRPACPKAVAVMFRGEGGTMPCLLATKRRQVV
jgi:hypothetical protein